MKKNQKQKEKNTTTEQLSASCGWREIQEQQGWDDFLHWCREQENTPHE